MSDYKKFLPLAGFVGMAAILVVGVSFFSGDKGNNEAAVVKSDTEEQKEGAYSPRPGVYCDGEWCDDHSETSLEHKKFTYNLRASREAMKAAGAPEYSSKKNKDGSTSFYLKGELVVGSKEARPCTMYNPDPNDSSKGTYIPADSPACITPGVSYGTVEQIAHDHKE